MVQCGSCGGDCEYLQMTDNGAMVCENCFSDWQNSDDEE